MRWILLIFGVFLSGCATYYTPGPYYTPATNASTSLGQVNNMVGANQPVEYRVGFQDGCDSGNVTAGNQAYTFKKDTQRVLVDAYYKQGWEDGFARCKNNSVAFNSTVYPSTSYGVGYSYWPRYYYPNYYWGGFSPWYGYGSGLYFNFGSRYGWRRPFYRPFRFGHRHRHSHRFKRGFRRRR